MDRFISPSKGIQDSLGFWILSREFRIPGILGRSGRFFVSGSQIPDFNRQWDFRFLDLYSGFQSPRLQISQAKNSRIPESGFPYMGQLLACMFCFSISDHVMLPQRTDSFKCRPAVSTCIWMPNLLNDFKANFLEKIVSSEFIQENKTCKLKRSIVKLVPFPTII